MEKWEMYKDSVIWKKGETTNCPNLGTPSLVLFLLISSHCDKDSRKYSKYGGPKLDSVVRLILEYINYRN